MRVSHLPVIALVFAFHIAGFVQAGFAQAVSSMAGEVTDQSGAAVPGVLVTISNPARGLKFTTTTNDTGEYRLSELPPGGGYEASFTANGYAQFEVKRISLSVATVRTQNAALTVGARAEAVEVTASNSEVTIDTTTATVGNTFDVAALNKLPVQQRSDPTALFTMQPGVTDTGSVTGARVDQNDVTLDGLDVNDFATGGAVQRTREPELPPVLRARLSPTRQSTQSRSFMRMLPAMKHQQVPPVAASSSWSRKVARTNSTAILTSTIAILLWSPTVGSTTMPPLSFLATT